MNEWNLTWEQKQIHFLKHCVLFKTEDNGRSPESMQS
jgi:hypothetical protein